MAACISREVCNACSWVGMEGWWGIFLRVAFFNHSSVKPRGSSMSVMVNLGTQDVFELHFP